MASGGSPVRPRAARGAGTSHLGGGHRPLGDEPHVPRHLEAGQPGPAVRDDGPAGARRSRRPADGDLAVAAGRHRLTGLAPDADLQAGERRALGGQPRGIVVGRVDHHHRAEAVRRVVRVVQQARRERREGREQLRHPLGLDQLEGQRWLEVGHRHERAAGMQRGRHPLNRRDVEHRAGREHPVPVGVAEPEPGGDPRS
jgi:hypothetical protein